MPDRTIREGVMCMKFGAIAMIVLAGWALFAPAASGAEDLAIFGTARFESHNMSGVKSADNVALNTFTFMTNTGRRSSVSATVGQRMDLDDGGTDTLALSLGYTHNISRSSFVLVNYANYRVYENVDDGTLEDSADMLYFMHGWKVIKRGLLQCTLYTALSGDTAFDDNRMFSETVKFSGPFESRYRWDTSYQYGRSLVSDNHSINAWDFRAARPVSRNASVSLGFRTVEYKNNGGKDLKDDSWILTYNHKIR